MKRLKLGLAGLVAGMLLFSSALQAGVTVLGWPGGPEETALRAAAETYNATASDDDKVELIFFSRDGFFDKLAADLAAGSTEFDLNLLATYAIGRYAAFMDPLELPAAASDSFSDKVLATMQFEGKQYGIPTDLSLHYMYFRKDLMDQLLSDADWQEKYKSISQEHMGTELSPKDPDEWNWDDWMATALFFTKSINSDSPTRYGAVLQMKNLLFNMMVWHSTARSQGGDWMDADGNVTVDSPAFRSALELYKKLYDAGASPKDSTTYEYAEANAAFGAGQAATMLQWNAAFGELNDESKNPGSAGKIGTVAPPVGPEGRATHIHGLGLGLNKASGNKEGALKFLNWLASGEIMQAYAKSGGSPALNDDLVSAISEDRPDLVQLGQYAGQYGFVMNGGTSAKALQIYELQAKEFTGYWSGEQSLDDALTATTEGMQELLK